jgi:pimeloyl-ACP methyl ester carboxylesterase
LALAAALAWLLACAARTTPVLEPRGSLTTADGVEMVYEAAGSGATTLVFVHCWACDRTFWREQLDVFAADYRVVALDLPGHGESGTNRQAWSIAGLAGDVVTALEQLDLDDVVLIGHSMGGPVALLAAPRAAERVIGVVLVDTVHDAELDWSAEDAAPIIAAFEEDFAAANRQIIPQLFPPESDPELVAWVTERAVATDPAAAKGLLADFPNLRSAEILSGAGVPVRAINAAPLGTMIPATAVETNQRLADYDAAILDGVGHYLMLERPAEFNRLLATALEEIEPQRGPS